jgi:uncharacterized phage protein (TIGR01671 family)
MRTIKFRGKRLDNGEWVEGFYVQDPQYRHRIYLKPFQEATANTYYFVDPATVGQFSGLTDKNGKEIWEGDVLKRLHKTDDSKDGSWNIGDEMYRGPVVYSESVCAFVIRKGFDFKIEKATDLENIGNIHDNPELLTK